MTHRHRKVWPWWPEQDEAALQRWRGRIRRQRRRDLSKGRRLLGGLRVNAQRDVGRNAILAAVAEWRWQAFGRAPRAEMENPF